MLAGTPVILLREGTTRETGKDAQHANIEAARSVAETLRTTLGPRGMDKMLVQPSGDIVITNDGATILKFMEVEHPAAKMLVEVAKTQDEECGDGTKTSVILAGELLRAAEELLDQGIHPTIITQGYRLAADRATRVLSQGQRTLEAADTEALRKVAMTSMMSKGVSADRSFLSVLTVRAVRAVVEKEGGRLRCDRKNIQLVKKQGGDLADTELVEGLILDKDVAHPGMPRRIQDARIALMESALEVRKAETTTEVRITAPNEIEAYLSEEDRMVREMVDQVLRSGANVVLCEKGIDDAAQLYLARNKVLAVSRIKRSDLELLSKATGGDLVSRWAELEPGALGHAALVEERKVGEDRMTFVLGCRNARAVSLLVRGGTEHVVDEAERSLVDAISTVGLALEDGAVVTGAGASAVEISSDLRDYANTLGGREQMAVHAFAGALEVLPMTLAENAGMDKVGALIELKRRHRAGEHDAGVDVLAARIADMSGVAVEPVRVGRQAILSATEAAVMVLRVNDTIASKSTGKGGSGGAPARGGPSI
ncbi:MAG: TCP-1/cpn60 chaperonin family protein [Euryarchaeota archaeon]|nr:TCP-1/cpn60 chaperonin family protein [Euryarchaeota archaeon]MDE1880477.1 TCP-1/cpn60 chaperonin family protein [Euryarchaeota archaeon]